MRRLKGNVRTTFEKHRWLGTLMVQQPFPCALVNVGALPAAEAIQLFLKHRPNSRWVLLGQHAVQSTPQMWTAWIQASRNELRDGMVARSVDAEFLRFLAGTHHISEAFSRAGLQENQSSAWITFVPEAIGQPNDLGHLQPMPGDVDAFEEELQTVASSLGWEVESTEAILSIEGMRTLGIDVEGWPEDRLEEALLSHILMADDQSSSHR